ncbi:MAG: radical SAM protein [Saccharofermentans sp.]|nr:radical SAM protein [Saccharofermentans sp.]
MREYYNNRMYENCIICPRRCGVNRSLNQRGFCKMGDIPVVNLCMLHFGEEPIITGTRGSGTVFFEGCSLGCCFCQNFSVSRGATGCGKTMSPDELAQAFLSLQSQGAHNINLVTPGHFIPSVAEAIKIAKNTGLTIPVAVNSGGYESVESLKLLDGLVDIYMPDLKFYSNKLSKELCNAPDYYEVACKAIAEMYRQVGPAVIGEDGLMKRGLIVRHLMLPGQLFDTKKVLDYLCTTYGNNIYISLMNQYTPFEYKYPQMKLPEFMKRKVPAGHYNAASEYLMLLDQENAFLQDDASGDELLPEFKTD